MSSAVEKKFRTLPIKRIPISDNRASPLRCDCPGVSASTKGNGQSHLLSCDLNTGEVPLSYLKVA